MKVMIHKMEGCLPNTKLGFYQKGTYHNDSSLFLFMEVFMNINEIIEIFEQLKKYVFFIEMGQNKKIILKFTNDKFYHLLGLHKMNLDQFFPKNIISKDKRYKYIKKNPDKFQNVIENQFKRKNLLELRVKTFTKILDLLKGENTSLYNFKNQNKSNPYSNYNGDFALTKTYQYDIFCLLGLKIDTTYDKYLSCVPNSWMASHRINQLVEFRKASYMDKITAIPKEFLNDLINSIYV